MTLHKMVNGVRVDMTPAEEAAIKAEWAIEANRPPPVDARRAALEAVFTKAQVDALLSVL